MENKLEGYVVYYKSTGKTIPFGVVSNDSECRAITDYIPFNLKQYLVEIEDKRFYKHFGIDLKGLTRAAYVNIKAKKVVQGGSTITQQLSRNYLRDNRKTITRKLRESIKAIQIESRCTKEEILAQYFNNVYFGKNIRGIRAAAIHYFNKEITNLSHFESLTLLAILRGPNFYLSSPSKLEDRVSLINKTLFKKKIISRNRYEKNLKIKVSLKKEPLRIIRPNAVAFITDNINLNSHIVRSTVEFPLQQIIESFVRFSKYPVSVIALRESKVVAFASTYGSDYPFISKTNVGSTLKPFIHCYLREKGVSNKEKFNAYTNSHSWKVREIDYIKSYMNLDEALYYSNNNTFINASYKDGIDDVLKFLATLFKKDINNFLPASILGATKSGISLYELAYTYSTFFDRVYLNQAKKDCLHILYKVAHNRLKLHIENVFLKTGTTNDNKERYAIIGNSDLTFAILRNENTVNDMTKEGGFLAYIARWTQVFFNSNKNYKW